MSHFDLRRFKAIPHLPLTIVFNTLAAFDYFFSYFILIIYPFAVLLCSQIERKHTGNGSFDLSENGEFRAVK